MADINQPGPGSGSPGAGLVSSSPGLTSPIGAITSLKLAKNWGGLIDSRVLDSIILQRLEARNLIDARAATIPWKGEPKGEMTKDKTGYVREYQFCTIWAVEDASKKPHAFETHGLIRDYHKSIGHGGRIVGTPLSDGMSSTLGTEEGNTIYFKMASFTGRPRQVLTRCTETFSDCGRS